MEGCWPLMCSYSGQSLRSRLPPWWNGVVHLMYKKKLKNQRLPNKDHIVVFNNSKLLSPFFRWHFWLALLLTFVSGGSYSASPLSFIFVLSLVCKCQAMLNSRCTMFTVSWITPETRYEVASIICKSLINKIVICLGYWALYGAASTLWIDQ